MKTGYETIAILFIIFSVGFPAILYANEQYTPGNLYTIPWGNNPGSLSTEWNIPPNSPDWHGLEDPPGPWAISSNGEMVIADFGGTYEILL